MGLFQSRSSLTFIFVHRIAEAEVLVACFFSQNCRSRIAEPAAGSLPLGSCGGIAFTHLCKTVDFACIYKIGTEVIGNQISFFPWIFLLLSTQKPFSCCSPHKNLFIPKKCTHKRSMLRPYDDT
jgi:hypothetical protein